MKKAKKIAELAGYVAVIAIGVYFNRVGSYYATDCGCHPVFKCLIGVATAIAMLAAMVKLSVKLALISADYIFEKRNK